MTTSATPAHLDSYVEALRAHDWGFQHSSDQRVYKRGRDERKALSEAQVLIDKDFGLWNRYAPEAYRVHIVPGQQPKTEGGK